MALVVEGLSKPDIAERLVISRSTAKAHVSNILSETGVTNRAETIALALQQILTEKADDKTAHLASGQSPRWLMPVGIIALHYRHGD